MSSWTQEQLQEAEMQREFDNGYSYAMWQVKKMNEMWQEFEEWAQWSENNLFQLADGTVLDGKINP
jgi:hypothetical protein